MTWSVFSHCLSVLSYTSINLNAALYPSSLDTTWESFSCSRGLDLTRGPWHWESREEEKDRTVEEEKKEHKEQRELLKTGDKEKERKNGRGARWQPRRSSRVERAKCWSQLIPSTCFETKACALDPPVSWGEKREGSMHWRRRRGVGWQTVDWGRSKRIKGPEERDGREKERGWAYSHAVCWDMHQVCAKI